MVAKTLMVQGCTSDAGKSVLVAGLCRVFTRRGVKVAPFKPQNMALNSAVTPDGGEIGRAQAVQARACGLEPRTDFNPVLLKPNTDSGAQVIIHGKALSNMEAAAYHDYKKRAMNAVLESHARLSEQFDLIIVEGAGSPAEINLREGDIANMGFAEAVDCPVILVADIDRGGIFAHFIGTVDLLSPTEQARIKGFVVNRFRGDIGLLQPGLDWLEERSQKPVFGVIPFIHDLHLEAEDAINASQQLTTAKLKIAVPVLSRTSNHTDFDALRMEPEVDLVFVGKGSALPPCDLIILPGTKNTRADLDFLRSNHWHTDIQKHLRYGGKVMGICGGFQMLGMAVHDPDAIEGPAGSTNGLGYLDMETRMGAQKTLRRVEGKLLALPETTKQDSSKVSGYEIHAGQTTGPALDRPLVQLDNQLDGAISADGQIIGTYLHGVFDSDEARQAILAWAGLSGSGSFNYDAHIEANLERLADCLETHLNIEALLKNS